MLVYESMEAKSNTRNNLAEAYIDFVLSGKYPQNIYRFCKEAGISETEFYDEFGSMDAIKNYVFKRPMLETIDILAKDEAYKGYSAQEKILSFLFTWVQQLSSIRSFLLYQESKKGLSFYKDFYYSFYQHFREHIDLVVSEGIQNGEFPSRKYIDQFYTKALWTQLMFIFKFWLKDESKGFERTDAAVEKSAKIAFDMIGHGPIDSMIDFGRFMLGNVRA